MRRRMKAAVWLLAVCAFLVVIAAAEKPAVVTEEDYYGDWTVSQVLVNGVPVDFGTLERIAGLLYEGGAGYRTEDAVLTIEAGKARLTVGLGEKAKMKESAAAFEDGTLKLTDSLNILGKDVTLTIQEDGSLQSRARVSYGILSFGIELFLFRK